MSNYFRIVNVEGNESLAFSYDGRNYSVRSDHRAYANIRAALLDNDYAQAFSLYDAAESISRNFQRVSERVSLRGNTVYFDGEPVDSYLADTIIRFNNAGEDFTPLVNFLEKLYVNNNEFVREQLFRWVDDRDLTITDDGDVLAYKGVYRTDTGYRSSSSGHAIVNGVEFNGHIPQQVGDVVEMPRSEVTFDPYVACSTGLHVGTHKYATSYGDTLVRCAVNPRDIVSVPTDSYGQKMRTCRYTLLEEADDLVQEPVYKTKPEPVLSSAVWTYYVPSSSGQYDYTVTWTPGGGIVSCTCDGWRYRSDCRHADEVLDGKHQPNASSETKTLDSNKLRPGDTITSRKSGVRYNIVSVDPQRTQFVVQHPFDSKDRRVVSAINLPKSYNVSKALV